MGRLSLFFWSKFFTPAWQKILKLEKYLLVIYSMRVTGDQYSIDETQDVWCIFFTGQKIFTGQRFHVDNL